MSQNGKLQPNFDQQGTKMLNLTVLQRVDPFVEEILMTAAHVTFYGFDIELNQWGRKDVEGSLFVVKRNAQPRFQFIVMNRRTADNLVENLLGDFEYEVQLPYLLYRNADQEVNGIWFYNEQECKDVGKLFERILSAYSKVPSKAQVSSTKSEFEELEGYPTMAIMGGPLEPASSTASHAAEVPDDPSFVNFFSAAMNIGNASNANVTGQPYRPSPMAPSQPASAPFTLPTIQVPSPHAPAPTNTLRPVLDSPHLSSRSRTTNLVKPSSFFSPPSSLTHMMPPIPSSLPTAPPLNTSGNVHRPYGAPLLQPFPPPTPSPSLTPTPFQNHGPVLSKEKVREALHSLVQEDHFVDMVYRALLNAHHS